MLYKGNPVYIFDILEFTRDKIAFKEDAVFLIAVNDIDNTKILDCIRDILETKCNYIMTYGNTAEELHDAIDEIIIEQSLANPHLIDIVTVYFNEKILFDTLDFFMNYTYLKEDKHNYVIIADENHYNSIKEWLNNL